MSAPRIRPKPKRGAMTATSIAVVKIPRTTSDRRLAVRRVRAGTCAASARASTSASKKFVGNIDAHEQPRVEHDRGRREPGARDPRGRKRQERHHEEMDEVDPDQSQRRRTDEPHQVVVICPDDGDEQVAHRMADGRGQRGQRAENAGSSASRCAVTCSSRTGALLIEPSTFHFDARAPQDGAIPNVIQGRIAFIHDGRRDRPHRRRVEPGGGA
jgi:hypothetical protein